MMADLDLSNDQEKNLEKLLNWCKKEIPTLSKEKPKAGRPTSYITLGGYAGTGKTTLIGILYKELLKQDKNIKVAFCSYTGKASRVLKNKLSEVSGSVSTIHSLIYSPVTNDREEIIGWDLVDKVDEDLIVVDEASMVDNKIWDDLCSFGVPIIAVGDHGQLPPIGGSFNLMENPALRLTEIHRQAKDNPIIKLSIEARTKGIIPLGSFDGAVKKVSRQNYEAQEELMEMLQSYTDDLLILCGYNNTRIKLNSYIRQALEFQSPLPESGDRVICLRNNHTKKIFNGMLGTINSIIPKKEDYYEMEASMDDDIKPYSGTVLKRQFGESKTLNFTEERKITKKVDLFDFGYALTVHKAQGSQAPRVVLFEERFKQMDDIAWKKWLYTAVTRAEESLFILE
jgi:exodeoxyribonuclease-5